MLAEPGFREGSHIYASTFDEFGCQNLALGGSGAPRANFWLPGAI